MCADRRRLRTDESGSSALEFALIAPAFVMLLFGTFEIGWALHSAASVQYALERSARQVMIDNDATEEAVEAAMTATLTGIIPGTFEVSSSTTDVGAIDVRTFTSTYEHEMAIPIVGDFELTFTASTAVPLE